MKKVRHTAFDNFTLTDVERAQLTEKASKAWFYRTLDKVWFVALGDPELKQAFRDKATSLNGKLRPGSHGALRWLLMMYAVAIDRFGDDRGRVLDWLIDWNHRIFGTRVDRSTMDNRITSALARIKLKELPKWTHRAIKQRAARGQKTKTLRKT